MSKLENPKFRRDLADEILRRIDEHCVKTYDDGHRWHLGASIIGMECPRAIWYSYRWVYHKVFSGRMYRLFNRGHLEEKRNIEWLRAIGCEVIDTLADGSQQRIVGTLGHFGGSLDASGYLPEDFDITDELLFEFKTKKTGSEFTELKKKGVKVANWQHFCQMSVYGKKRGIKYALYFSTNKNDDEMHIECVPLDWNLADEKETLANSIITSRQAPARPFASRAYTTCKTSCDFVGICWDNVTPEKNCRSCWKSYPIADGEWYCEQFQTQIPRNFVPNGCDSWEAVR